jgi:hypothetical protein
MALTLFCFDVSIWAKMSSHKNGYYMPNYLGVFSHLVIIYAHDMMPAT